MIRTEWFIASCYCQAQIISLTYFHTPWYSNSRNHFSCLTCQMVCKHFTIPWIMQNSIDAFSFVEEVFMENYTSVNFPTIIAFIFWLMLNLIFCESKIRRLNCLDHNWSSNHLEKILLRANDKNITSHR